MPQKRLLLIGASRGLGFALAEEYLRRDWLIVATERSRDNRSSMILPRGLINDSK